jgi:acetoin utilization deacetylase AcuC-like enzyme
VKIFHSDLTLLNLSKFGIQIPMKDERVLKIVDFLKAQNISLHESFIQDIKLTSRDLERVHDSHYIKRIFGHKTDRSEAIMETFELRNSQGEFHRFNPADAIYPLEDLIEKFLNQTKGSIAAVAEALDSGESFFLGGGFHHAMSFGGRGFCLVNDIVIAARWAQANDLAKNIWIIDVDAHKGDGTAELTYEDPSIHTLSIHIKRAGHWTAVSLTPRANYIPGFLVAQSILELMKVMGQATDHPCKEVYSTCP